MDSRNAKVYKRIEPGNFNVYSGLERLKKARAIGCNPAYLGMDSYVCSRLFSTKTAIIAKLS